MSTEVATNEKSYSFFRESFWGLDDYKETYHTGAPIMSVIDTKLSVTEEKLTKFINRRKKETIYQLKGFFRGGVDNQNSRDEFTNYILIALYYLASVHDGRETVIRNAALLSRRRSDIPSYLSKVKELPMPKTPEGFCTMLMYYDQNTMNLTGDLVKVINKLIRLSGSNDTFKPNDIPSLPDTAMTEIENLVADELRSYWLKEISRRVRRDAKYRATKNWKESPEFSITSDNFIYEIKVEDVDDALDVMTEVLYGLIPKVLQMDDRGFAKRLSSTKKYKEEMDEAVKEASNLRKALQEKEKEIARLNTLVSHKDEELKTLKDKPSGKAKDVQSINQLKEERKALVKKNEGLLADLNSMCARNQELTEQNNLLCKAQEELLDRIETLQKGDPIDYENARFMFIGGREDTIKSLSKLFKKSKFTDTVNVPSRVEMVKGYECIFYLAKNIAHNTVYKYKNLVSKADIKDFYLSGTSVTGILNEIRELYYKSPYRE